MHAVHAGLLEQTRGLLQHGADVAAVEPIYGSSALHEAAYSGSPAMVVLLLEYGAQTTCTDLEGRLPLHWATHNASPEVSAGFFPVRMLMVLSIVLLFLNDLFFL